MKNILITGASQGIGKAAAIEAAKAQMFVGINYNQNSKGAEKCLKLVRDSGGDGIILQCDVANNKSVKGMFNDFLDKAGTIDGVFNNAGITGPISPIQDLSPDDLKMVVDTNISGAFYVAQESARVMISQKSGIIVNMSSIAAYWGWRRICSLCNVKGCYSFSYLWDGKRTWKIWNKS